MIKKLIAFLSISFLFAFNHSLKPLPTTGHYQFTIEVPPVVALELEHFENGNIKPLTVFLDQPIKDGQLSIVASEKIPLIMAVEDFRKLKTEIHQAGRFRGADLTKVLFYPVIWENNRAYFVSSGKAVINGISQKRSGKTQRNDPAFASILGKNSALVSPQIPSQSKSTALRVGNGKAKIFTEYKGIHRITGRDLLDSDISIGDIVPRSIKLYFKGAELPIYVFGEGDNRFDESDYIEFYAELPLFDLEDDNGNPIPSDQYLNPFTRYSVYWLDWGQGDIGLRMVDESGEIRTSNSNEIERNDYYLQTDHYEKNNQFSALEVGGTDTLSYYRDHYFYDLGVGRGEKKAYSFNLTGVVEIGGLFVFPKVTTQLTGITTVEGVNHDVEIFLNDRSIIASNSNWKKQESKRFTYSDGQLNYYYLEGENNLEISVRDNGYSDRVSLNWFEISYFRHYVADNNQISFEAEPRPASFTPAPGKKYLEYEITGFESPDITIYKLGLSNIINFIKSRDIDADGRVTYRVKFQDELNSLGDKYIAIGGNERLSPAEIMVETTPELSLLDPSNSADYLFITHSKFLSYAQQYADYHSSKNGFKTMVVDVDDIYDAFKWGIKSPLAIKRFIKHAYSEWDQNNKLRYVLFIGDANSSYALSTFENTTDFVPTFLFQTYERGASASDFEYALLDGVDESGEPDNFGDIFVGRIPVKTNEDLINYLDKVIEYESDETKTGDWTSRMLFISGNDANTFESGDRERPVFRTQNNRIILHQADAGFMPLRLNTIKDTDLAIDPNFGGTQQLSNYINSDGISYINFFGHGGSGIWADVSLMGHNDIRNLFNKGRYPIVTSMTCYTGQYESEASPGLMESLVLAKDKGAIATFGSTGLGFVQNDFAIMWYLLPSLVRNKLSIGEATNATKAFYFSNLGEYFYDNYSNMALQYFTLRKSMIHQYNLIGDPAIRLNQPEETIDAELVHDLFVTDVFDLQLKINDEQWASSGGYYHIMDERKNILKTSSFAIGTELDSIDIPFGETFAGDWGFLYVYLNNGTTDGIASLPFAVNSSVIDSIAYDPEDLEPNSTIQITWYFNSNTDVTGGTFSYKYATIPLLEIRDNVFQLQSEIQPLNQDQFIVYSLNLQLEDGRNQTIFGNNFLIQNEKADIFTYERNAEIIGGENLLFQYRVGNLGINPADSLFIIALLEADTIHGLDSTTLDSRSEKILSIPYNGSIEGNSNLLTLYADYTNRIVEFSEANNFYSTQVNFSRFYLHPDIGTTYDRQQEVTVNIDDIVEIVAHSGAINATSTILYKSEPTINIDESVFQVVPMKNGDLSVALTIENDASTIQDSIFYKVYWNESYLQKNNIDIDSVSVGFYDEQFNQWYNSADFRVDADGRFFYGKHDKLATLALLIAKDQVSPEIEVAIDGYRISESSQTNNNYFVSKSPKISIVIHDQQGINISSDKLKLILNGETFAQSDYLFESSISNTRKIGLAIYPELNAGQNHELVVQSEDLNGNKIESSYVFRVDTEFTLDLFGVFPNPFDQALYDKCYVQFRVTQFVRNSDFRAALYSLGGKKIRDFTHQDLNNDGQSIQQMQELVWDGKDNDFQDVAIGVYFLKISAVGEDGNKAEEIAKIALIR
jgi:hypothetical protein